MKPRHPIIPRSTWPYALRLALRSKPSAQKISLAILPRIAYYYWQATKVTKKAQDGPKELVRVTHEK
jgi:hypothetical protein